MIAFLNQHFGLLAWFAVPAAVILMLAREKTVARSAGCLFASAGLAWFLVLLYGLHAYLNVIARYVDFAATALIVPLSIVFAQAWLQGRQRLVIACVSSILVVNVLLVASTDNRLMFGEKALVDLVRTTPEPIATDPGTLRGATMMLEWAGLVGSAQAAPPSPGRIYFFNSRPRRGIPSDWVVQQPEANWQELARLEKPRKPMAYLAHMLGVGSYLPSGIANKLDPQPSYATLYRIPATTPTR